VLADFIESLTVLLEQLVFTFGVPGVALVALLENLFPPTPSEALYPLFGKMAHDGWFSLPAIIAAGVIGSLTGALIFYTIGYRLGEARTRTAIDSLGTLRVGRLRVVIISQAQYEQGMNLFRRYGGRIVFIARLLPLVHGIVSIPAGVVRMNLLLFAFYTSLGAALWIAPLSLFGFWLGDNWEQVLIWLDVYEYLIYAVVLLLLAYYIFRRIRNRQRSTLTDQQPGETT